MVYSSQAFLKHQKQLERRRALTKEKKERLAAQQAAVEADIDPSTIGAQAARKAPAPIRQARENLTDAFMLMGGVPALVRWGKKNLTEFYRIWARLIPKEAADDSAATNLETLLNVLASRGSDIAIAAKQLGPEKMEQGRVAAEAEAALTAFEAFDEDAATIQ